MITDSRRFNTGLIFFIILILLTTVRIVFSLGVAERLTDNQIDIYYTLVTQIICMGLIPFAMYYFMVIKKENRQGVEIFKDFGYNKLSVKVIIISVIAGFLLYYLTIGVAAIWTGILITSGYTLPVSPGTIYTSPESLVLWVFIIGVLPGIFEELTHRGMLINSYRKSSEEEAVFFSALLFALMHQDARQFGYAFVGGIILGLFFVKSNSIIPPMIMHFINNTINTVLDYSSQTGNKLGEYYEKFFGLFKNPIFTLLFLASCVAAGVLIYGLIILVDIITSKQANKPTSWRDFDLAKIFRGTKNNIGNDVFLYSAIILGVVTTIFSYAWGLMR